MIPQRPHGCIIGFSLVELSIVLVILGLLVGGVLAGQSLIRAAELRAVIAEQSRYVTATQSFRDKYFSLPGDMNNATRFWGRLNTNADCVTNSGAAGPLATGACDGDGNGQLSNAAVVYPASTSTESMQFWRHLALAGLIEGSYTGIAGSGSGTDSMLGINVPRSRMSSAGWFNYYLMGFGGDAITSAGDYGNALTFGGSVTASFTYGANLKAEEAWNIDTKLDDGKPGAGKVIAQWWDTCTTAANMTDKTGAYVLSDVTNQCSLTFANAF